MVVFTRSWARAVVVVDRRKRNASRQVAGIVFRLELEVRVVICASKELAEVESSQLYR